MYYNLEPDVLHQRALDGIVSVWLAHLALTFPTPFIT
jgi:hypothetical protein